MENESLEDRAERMGYTVGREQLTGMVILCKKDNSLAPQILQDEHIATMVLMGIEQDQKKKKNSPQKNLH